MKRKSNKCLEFITPDYDRLLVIYIYYTCTMRILYDNVSHWFSYNTAFSETDQWGEDFTSLKRANATNTE